ncbi:hybrid sensor histidine kinase/response regulator [Singulisphaera acidiphila]|uniref:histidine kinase n=1 Tax=Singulisphaera acidiphila (strain ATCC BAA-1392 / DSM 18658 / VKM B-2454 / MOB10) TaxID=886293 RepID=L0DDG9_SINAD|nr:ATP-binding protein [Singulisphaera acidiphila]AGA26895.1 histidine kinase,Response regulator receiver domain protein,histidine kinase [Singulisphaera acidiphila DSM 18658]
MESETSRSRILIIDDNQPDRLLYQRALPGFKVEFADSDEAKFARLVREPFDLIILGLQLPELSSERMLTWIRSELCLELPVVVVIDGDCESLAVDWLERGANDYLTKDELPTRRVAATVRGVLERNRLDHARRAAEQELRRQQEEYDLALRQLRDAQTHLVQSEKMASLGQLVAGIAHEINNPLAYVSNNVAVLDRDVHGIVALMTEYRNALGGSVPEAIRLAEARIDLEYTLENLDRLIASTKQGLQRVREIVVGLRDFSRIDANDRKLISPNDAIRTTLEMVRYQIRHKGINLVVDLGELPLISCFAGKINQVLLNIIMNAIQAVDPGATITVRSWSSPEKQEVYLSLSDNGPGIPESIQDKIFDPFFTTKPQGLGTGLGLWITANIVKEHQGRIELQTDPAQGTTFTLIFPIRCADLP